MIQRGKDRGIQKRTLKQCEYQDCHQGMVKTLLGGLYECNSCNGLGLVDKETGEALPEREVIRQLLLRLKAQRAHIRELAQLVPQAPDTVERQKKRYE